MSPAPTDSIFKQTLPIDLLPISVKAAMERVLQAGHTIGIACSGGADSVFLAHWWHARYPEARARTVVLHFNHRTRGADSDKDAASVQALAHTLGMRCIMGRRPIDEQSVSKPATEEDLREARFQFFERAWVSEDLGILLTAHHLEDRVESLLMRLSRGSALEGCVAPAAMREFRSGMCVARPLLHLRKRALIEALHGAGITWREDASNQDSRYYRNFIRNELIPRWQETQSNDIIQGIGDSIAHLEADALLLDQLTLDALEGVNLGSQRFPLQSLRTLPLPLLRRAVRRWFNAHPPCGSISHRQLETLLALGWTGPSAISADHTLHRTIEGDWFLEGQQAALDFRHLEYCLPTGSQLCFPNGSILFSEQIPIDPTLYQSITQGQDDPLTQVHVDIRALQEPALSIIRFWHDGMRYQPLGATHHKKLKACFIDRKIPAHLRRQLPVVCNHEGSILWVPGLQPSESGRIQPDSKTLLRLTYLASSPCFPS